MRPLTDFQEFRQFLASFTNYEKLPTFHYGPQTLGIERMREFVRDLGDPQGAYPSVHIGGTKGKGTTTLLLAALLRVSGLRVGTYTSPHVEHLRERIRVGSESISDQQLVETTNAVLPALERRVNTPAFPTFFELMTAIAMLHFATEAVDYAVFEVGLGGRLDATNILSARYSAITSIGLEHTELLGDSLASIAREKAGIVKSSTPLVCGELPPEARETVAEIAREIGAPLTFTSANEVQIDDDRRLHLDGIDVPLDAPAIRGPGLRTDLAIAWRLYRRILGELGLPLESTHVQHALQEMVLPARVEVFDGDPPVCLDGAHTSESFDALAAALDEIGLPRPRTLVFALSVDKRCDEILTRLPEIADEVIFTRVDSARAIDPQELAERSGRGRIIDTPQDALHAALDEGNAVVVAGSIYLAGAVRGLLTANTQ